MSVIDEEVRDVLAGLSFHVGGALPASLIPVAQAHGVRIGSWAFPGALGVPHDDREQAAQRLRELGRSLRRRATDAGISMLVRGEAGWPAGTECDLLPCLWVRGNTDIAGLLNAAVAVTGTRACTQYGAQTAADLAAGLAVNGWTVVTNAGFGIDLHAVNHALAIEGPAPVLLTAGGLDHRLADPIGNVVEQTAARGAVISPFPAGTDPNESRLRLRNRLLGGLTVATVLVEADVRSDALLTLDAAVGTGRLACAMPGPVATAESAGCHARIADGTARLVTGAGSVILAIGWPGGSTPAEGLYAVRAVVSGAGRCSTSGRSRTSMRRMPRSMCCSTGTARSN